MQSIKQFLKFGIVGLSNTLISQIIYMIAVSLGAHYLAASVIAFIISVLNAFFWQNKFVFKEEEDKEKRVWWKVLLKTYAAYAFTGLLLNNLLLIMWIDLIRIESFTPALTDLVNSFGINISNHDLAVDIAPLLNIVVNVPINFVINKFWAYRQKKVAS
ncbi:MAG: GtrA family protein [Huintestinicola sp.]